MKTNTISSGNDHDEAFFFDSTRKDTLKLWQDGNNQARLTNADYNYRVKFFEAYEIDATRDGNDFARIWDSAGDDTVVISRLPESPEVMKIEIDSADGSYDAVATGFVNGVFYSITGGFDTAHMYDSPRDDQLWGYNHKSVMNYYYIWDKTIVDYSDGSHRPNDVSDWDLFDLTAFQKDSLVVEDAGFELPGEEELSHG